MIQWPDFKFVPINLLVMKDWYSILQYRKTREDNMQVQILKEAGFEEALLGLSLSFYDHKVPLVDWSMLKVLPLNSKLESARYAQKGNFFWTDAKYEKAKKIAVHLATKQPPEDYEVRNNLAYISAEQKFLEQIDVWIYVQASRDFWSEFDTYRVDMSKQSSSTRHTLAKRPVEPADFEEGTLQSAIDAFNEALKFYHDKNNSAYHDGSILKKNLPEGWLQERVIKTSYKTLKWILEQRDGHGLKSWKIFKDEILKQLEHPEYINLEQA